MNIPGTLRRRTAVVVAALGLAACVQPSAAPGGHAAGPVAANPGSYGLAAVTQLDRLPYVRMNTEAGGQSSYDRSTTDAHQGNDDFNNFLYTTANGEKVMLDQKGPGTVYRIWVTGFNASTDWVRVYFDGEATPRINLMLRDMFSGTTAPFLRPLVADDTRSSGGFTSYLPLPYHSSVRITTNMSNYYNIGYHTFSSDTPVTTWTGSEDSTAARNAWNAVGTDPKVANAPVTVSGATTLAPNATQTLLDVAGPRSVSSVRLTVPGITATSAPTDDGRAHRGSSRFTMAVDPANTGVTLTRRMDHGIADQKANILVDGVLAGTWFDGGVDTTYRWRDSSFAIPASLTAGRSAITVTVQFVSSANDWNEFTYWTYSTVNGGTALSDTLDVGNAASESAHQYAITTQTWSGSGSFVYPVTVTDTGRAHKGFSQFAMAVAPGNTGVNLVRRLDYGIPDQKATVFVDGVSAGTWLDAGSDSVNRWRDSTFAIPASLTAGRSRITVKVQFVSSGNDWNEFTYWTYSTVTGATVTSDTLDVGDAASQAAHGYTIDTPTWSGTRTFQYNTADILDNTVIKAYWDNETTPSVNAPLGSFFGMGQNGEGHARALAMGVDAGGTLYAYFPMPFQGHATIRLSSTRTLTTNAIAYEIKHQAFTDSFKDVGYFRTSYQAVTPAVVNQDIPILDTTGSGTFVGTVISYAGDPGRTYLEGDERMLVDGSGTPAIQGTGTEDFFNAGWYFNRGAFSQPMAGMTTHTNDGTTDRTAAYRLLLQDAVPFRKSITVSIQHGTHDDTTNSAWVLAYYYQKPVNRMVLTDTLNVGNPSSESGHSYSITTATWSGTRTSTYEGPQDTTSITDDGRAFKGYSQFSMATQSANQGVVLRRRFDQGIINQQATVFVNGVLVGPWYHAGGNRFHNWRDDDLLIPASFTTGRTRITVRVQFLSSSLDWNEFSYWAYTLTP